MVTRRAGWSRSAQEAYGRRARAARWSRRRGGRAHRRPEPRAVGRSCRWAPSSLGQRRADAWQPREGRRRGMPAPSFRHTLVWDSGVFSSNGVREAQRILKTIDTEDIPGGWGDNNGIGRHRHIHDPGIQQEPVLDMQEVTLVDRNAVSFLARCEADGRLFAHCPASLRRWIVRERDGKEAVQQHVVRRMKAREET